MAGRLRPPGLLPRSCSGAGPAGRDSGVHRPGEHAHDPDLDRALGKLIAIDGLNRAPGRPDPA
jgi:hypothetical protein